MAARHMCCSMGNAVGRKSLEGGRVQAGCLSAKSFQVSAMSLLSPPRLPLVLMQIGTGRAKMQVVLICACSDRHSPHSRLSGNGFLSCKPAVSHAGDEARPVRDYAGDEARINQTVRGRGVSTYESWDLLSLFFCQEGVGSSMSSQSVVNLFLLPSGKKLIHRLNRDRQLLGKGSVLVHLASQFEG